KKKRGGRSKSFDSVRSDDSGGEEVDLSPSAVLDLFRAHPRALKWPEIRDLVGVQRGAAVDQLRRGLRGLCHAGELHIDSRGAYQCSTPETTIEGTIARNDRGRLVLRPSRGGDAPPVRLTRDSRLRVGDRVRARIVEEQAVIADVVARSSEPII